MNTWSMQMKIGSDLDREWYPTKFVIGYKICPDTELRNNIIKYINRSDNYEDFTYQSYPFTLDGRTHYHFRLYHQLDVPFDEEIINNEEYSLIIEDTDIPKMIDEHCSSFLTINKTIDRWIFKVDYTPSLVSVIDKKTSHIEDYLSFEVDSGMFSLK